MERGRPPPLGLGVNWWWAAGGPPRGSSGSGRWLLDGDEPSCGGLRTFRRVTGDPVPGDGGVFRFEGKLFSATRYNLKFISLIAASY